MSSAGRAGFARSVESVFAGRRRWVWMLALAGVLTAAAPLLAAADNDAERITSRARQALDNDAQLGALSLGVSIRNETATVWGSVPSASLGERAVLCLSRVPGVARVENQLTVESPTDSLFDFLKLPARPWSPKPIPGMRTLIRGRRRASDADIAQASAHRPGVRARVRCRCSCRLPRPWRAPRRRPRSCRAPRRRLRSWHRARPRRLQSPCRHSAPVTRPMPVPLHDTTPVKASPTTSIVRSPQLQQGNERLRGIRAEVRGGAVYLRRQHPRLARTAQLRPADCPTSHRRGVVLDGVRRRGNRNFRIPAEARRDRRRRGPARFFRSRCVSSSASVESGEEGPVWKIPGPVGGRVVEKQKPSPRGCDEGPMSLEC